ncbi:MAG TPA: response regulator transcription factor [Terriglobales bacterium]|jgi:DNA-binding NarL/FixJ family response regulator
MNTVRVLIVDDNKSLREAVRRMLAFWPSGEVCGEASNGREAIEKCVELHPDVVLMDIGMPEMDGLAATRRLGELAPEIEVLVFTEHESQHAMAAALGAGARGYLAKSKSTHLREAIEAVAQHQHYSGLKSELSRHTSA